MGSIIGSEIIHFKEVDSTNNQIKNQESDLQNGSVIISDFQTNGKGHHNNYWESEKGKNLTFSILLKPDNILAENQFDISRFVCLALIDYLKSKKITAKIKWPNDIYIDDKKISGILIENSILGNKIKSSIIGIGININQDFFDPNLPNPVSLKQITGKIHDLNKELSQIIIFLNTRFDQLITNKNQQKAEYLNHLYRINVLSEFKSQDNKFSGTITGITSFGQLQIEVNNKTGTFNFKEIEFL